MGWVHGGDCCCMVILFPCPLSFFLGGVKSNAACPRPHKQNKTVPMRHDGEGDNLVSQWANERTPGRYCGRRDGPAYMLRTLPPHFHTLDNRCLSRTTWSNEIFLYHYFLSRKKKKKKKNTASLDCKPRVRPMRVPFGSWIPSPRLSRSAFLSSFAATVRGHVTHVRSSKSIFIGSSELWVSGLEPVVCCHQRELRRVVLCSQVLRSLRQFHSASLGRPPA